ncbi:cycloartenol synthetase [Naegleria gruberi]|uniref:Terpene cyclase/mutase family member n=1 Tax=Naegleria gruberi TaxID=5762 RepID=D2UZA8_NAEGR|nr:cycloartenol synthetase [Naegleria gruberi]EFC50118.1 cycloartenol synthetase [Naegleria gruberi]|eukprot:XP_002682862.1 cycloartenol synthetase [Naegleria gruberi strain NEG-M]
MSINLNKLLEEFKFDSYDYSQSGPIEWRLVVKEGRQRWIPFPQSLLKQSGEEQSNVDKHLLNKPSNFEDPITYINNHPLVVGTTSSNISSTNDDDQATTNADNDDKLKYIFNKSNNYIINLDEHQVDASILKAIDFYSSVQTQDGHWAGDYGGPMFLLPGIVIVLYICQKRLPKPFEYEIVRYILSKQNQDGGYGLHIEGHSTIFGTVLNYVALRLLGVSPDHSCMKLTLEFLSKEPANGALGAPQWAKLYLCCLGLMDWDCIDPIPCELWLLPDWFPYIQPGKWWCHCRVVYLPMAYLYGIKKVYANAETDPIISQLRNELYDQVSKTSYQNQPWSKYRSYVNPRDNYHPFTQLYSKFASVLTVYEKYINFSFLRNASLKKCIEHIKYEDSVTNHICIGPVNKVLNMLSVFFSDGSDSELFNKHLDRVYDYLWLSDDGMKFQGYNGSQLWDTAFASQAICEYYKRFKNQDNQISCQGSFKNEHLNSLLNAYNFINFTQVKEDVPNRMEYYRHQSKGGWPFSTRDHGWPISDCTAEGLKAVLTLYDFDELILSEERLTDAVRVILSMFNGGTNGGWATYELSRTHSWIEIINPAALYGEIMIDYPHTECTSACITALLQFKKHFPQSPYVPMIDDSIKHAIKVIEGKQMEEGGWYGGWAVCFCYGTWFATTAIVSADPTLNYGNSQALKRGCDFIVAKQMEDGGWGESYLSCVTHRYSHAETSRVISTAWSLLALMTSNYPNLKVIEKGIYCLMRKQLPNGDFPQESISGVFNHNCMITYTNYRNIFPIWALSMYMNKYHSKLVQ